ncbi:putative protein N(5)-glutamine methyltransferase [Nocardioides sp. SYSU DS0663]|uniref:putative protein N(5)-glutamine methyltransferase n=1 Tax=Nocardioides sp. SYSU DS0663 TaxID=3416445 RepID=UPI003F4B4B7E
MGTVERLRAAGCVYAEQEAALLVEAATDAEHLERLVAARTRGLPLEHVLGWADLGGVRVRLDPGVFVPRRRTGLLVRLALEAAPDEHGAVVVDLCCGSGAVAAAVVAARPDLEVHAADVDPAAVRCARRNLDPQRVHEGDLLDALPATLRGRVAVLVANAPYVPSGQVALMPPEARDYEDRIALDGGPDGLDVQRRIAAALSPWLSPGATVLLETSRQQAAGSRALLEAAGLRADVVHDPELDGWAARGHA